MKLSFIITDLNYGGAQLQTIHSLNGLAEMGYTIQIVSLTNELTLANLLNKAIKVEHLDGKEMLKVSKRSLISLFAQQKKLAGLVQNFQPDLIVGVMVMAHIAARAIKPKISPKPKLVIYHHATEIAQDPPKNLVIKLFYKAANHFAKKDDAHIYISKAVKEDIEQAYQVNESFIVHNALPKTTISDQYQQELLSELNLKQQEFIVIPGRIQKHKGQVFFLDSTNSILKEKKLKIVFAGFGPDEKKLHQIAQEKDIAEQINITGKISNKALLALLKTAKFCVIPSIEEGLGNVAIEALMMGTTCLTSDAGGLQEIVNHEKNGYVFIKNDASSLNKQLLQLVNNFSSLKIEPKVLQEDYEQRFSMEHHLKQLATIFDKIS